MQHWGFHTKRGDGCLPLATKLPGETFHHLQGELIVFLMSCYQRLMAPYRRSSQLPMMRTHAYLGLVSLSPCLRWFPFFVNFCWKFLYNELPLHHEERSSDIYLQGRDQARIHSNLLHPPFVTSAPRSTELAGRSGSGTCL